MDDCRQRAGEHGRRGVHRRHVDVGDHPQAAPGEWAGVGCGACHQVPPPACSAIRLARARTASHTPGSTAVTLTTPSATWLTHMRAAAAWGSLLLLYCCLRVGWLAMQSLSRARRWLTCKWLRNKCTRATKMHRQLTQTKRLTVRSCVRRCSATSQAKWMQWHEVGVCMDLHGPAWACMRVCACACMRLQLACNACWASSNALHAASAEHIHCMPLVAAFGHAPRC